jgi:hypothetical protein
MFMYRFLCRIVFVCVGRHYFYLSENQETKLPGPLVIVYLTLEEIFNCLPEWLLPSTMYESSCCSTFLSALGIVSVLNFHRLIGVIFLLLF